MAAPTDGRMKGQMVDMQEIGPFNVSEIRAFGVMYCNGFKRWSSVSCNTGKEHWFQKIHARF